MAQNNEFMREKQATKGGLRPKWKIRKKRQILLNGRTIFSKIGPRRLHSHKKCYCSLSFLSVFFLFLLYLLVLVSLLFFYKPPPFYKLLFISYLNHPSLPNILPLMTLVSFCIWRRWQRNPLSCDLHCLGYFLINAANKAIAHHLMQRQQATPN